MSKTRRKYTAEALDRKWLGHISTINGSVLNCV